LTIGNSWAYHGTRFTLKGYCVFQLDYGHVPQLPGIGGMDLIENSAQQLKIFVDQVLNATGTSKVKMQNPVIRGHFCEITAFILLNLPWLFLSG